MEDKGPTLVYWRIRGLIELAKLIMEFGKKPYQMQYIKEGLPPDYSRKHWFDQKFNLGLDYPDLPYLIDGDLKFSQSITIYFYLMETYVPELLGKTETEKAKVQEGFFVLREIKEATTLQCYSSDKSKATESVVTHTPKLELVEKKLGENEWLIGDSPTVCDLLLMEVTDQFQMITQGTWLNDHPILAAHNARTKDIPNIKEYKNSSRFYEGPFHNPRAPTNNVPADYWE